MKFSKRVGKFALKPARFAFAAILPALFFTTFALAQQPAAAPAATTPAPYAARNEVFLVVGQVLVPDHNISPNGGFSTNALTFKGGAAFEIGLARRIATMDHFTVTAELPFAILPQVKLGRSSGGNAATNYSAAFATPSLRLSFRPGSRLQPWASGGAGYAREEGGNTLVDGSINAQSRISNTYAIQFGAGVDYRFSKYISFRADGRDFFAPLPKLGVTQTDSRGHNVIYGGGVVLHF